MMVHRDGKRGKSLMLARTFPGVGRIHRVSGTAVASTHRKINKMLGDLFDVGRLDLLRAVRDGAIAPMVLYDAYTRKALHQLPLGGTGRPLVAAMREWLPTFTASDGHRAGIATTIRYFEREDASALVADLPRVLESLRKTLGAEYPASFDHARAHAQAFVRSTLKRSHALWAEVAAVEPIRAKTRVRRRPLTPDQMREHFPAPDSNQDDAIAWTMATTGMHQKELWGEWSVRALSVRIEGTKREGRKRDVPLVMVPLAPIIHRRTFEDHVRARFGRTLTPYDLRRTYANWLEAAGIPRTRRKLYLGHGAGDVTDLYERHEVAAFLTEDGAKLRDYIGPTGAASPRIALVSDTRRPIDDTARQETA